MILTVVLFLIFFKIDIFLKTDTLIPLEVQIYLQDKVGKKGSLVFYGSIPEQIVSEQDIELDIDTNKKAYFTEILNSDNVNYTIECGPWKADKLNFKMLIFCDLNETIPHGDYNIQFNSTMMYQGYNFKVFSKTKLEIIKLDKDIIDLYSDIQTINVTDNKDIYELKFKIISYNNQILYEDLYHNPIECFQENNDLLICKITKEKLEGLMSVEGEEIKIISFNNDNDFFQYLYLVPPIKVYFNNIKNKEDIYVNINKLLTKEEPPYGGIIAYETNITSISYVFSGAFLMSFKGEEGEEDMYCRFVKGNILSLIMICRAESKIRTLSLKEIKNEIQLDDINIKYNFRIQPINNNEIFTIGDYTSSIIYAINPEILNFTEKDTIIIRYSIFYPDAYTGITFNENAPDLICEDLGHNSIKKCIVPKSHFKDKDSGYYYTKYTNQNTNKKVIAYESIPVKVILPIDNKEDKKEDKIYNEDSNNTILIIIILSICFLIIIGIIIFICIIKKKKNITELNEEIIENNNIKEII